MNNDNTTGLDLDLKIPLEYPRGMDISTPEYKHDLTIELALHAGNIFEIIQFLGKQASNDSVEIIERFAEMLITLGTVGSGFLIALEQVEAAFWRQSRNNSKVLDLSAQPENLNITAEYVSKLINRDDLPEEAKAVLHSWCAEHPGGENV